LLSGASWKGSSDENATHGGRDIGVASLRRARYTGVYVDRRIAHSLAGAGALGRGGRVHRRQALGKGMETRTIAIIIIVAIAIIYATIFLVGWKLAKIRTRRQGFPRSRQNGHRP
jgi:hypothetical protein